VAGERPINADVPPAKPARAQKPKRRRRPVPAALKAVGGLFALAVVFIVAAIVGGGGGSGEPATSASAPVSPSRGDASSSSSSTPANELGYPDFATANTTRVGGGDPASTAAAVALAAYPSTDPAQRPDAVTLVDAADWQGAIAAAVLMAQPVAAPVLVAEADGLPEATEQALDSLDPQGGKATRGAQAFVLGAAAAPSDLQATGIGGSGAAAAAAVAKLRDELVGSPPRHIVIAPEAAPAFAMPAAAWAARSGDPVLFSGEKRLPAATAKALKRHPRTPIYVLGPSSAISSSVVREIGKLAGGVNRVSGEEPVANAIELARYSSGDFGWNVNDPGHGFVVARSDEPLDAAAAAALSASGTWGPLLLTDSADTLPAALRGYLLDVKPGYTTDPTRAFYNHVWVIGDEEAIDVNQQAKIDELAELAKIGGGP
jgi:putative cell wall binding repeat protein